MKKIQFSSIIDVIRSVVVFRRCSTTKALETTLTGHFDKLNDRKRMGIVLSFLIPSLLSAQGVEFSGDVNTKWGVAAPWTNEEGAGRFTIGDTFIKGKINAWYGNSSCYAEGTFSYDVLGGGNLSNGFNLSLNELWADYSSSFWGIRIGRQKTAWGKADGIDITNVICPSDMKSLASISEGGAKLAIDAVRFSLTANSFTMDAYWIPFFTPASLPLESGNILRKYIVPSSVDFEIPSYGNLTIPVQVNSFSEPEIAIWNGEYALKLSGYLSALDVSLYGFYGWDDVPFFDYSVSYGAPLDPSNPLSALPEALNVNGEYKRMGMAGLDAALPIGPTVLRLESAFFPMRHFQKSSEAILQEKQSGESAETTEQHNELSGLLGLDWMPSGWTFTAQYYCDAVFGDIEKLDRENAYEHGVTLSASKSLLSDTLKLSVAAVLGLNDFDSLIKPTVDYSLSDQINLGCGAFIFIPGPDRDGQKHEGTYGAYKDLSTLFISARFSF